MSALTTGQIALCALLFGAGVGTGTVAPKVKKHVSARQEVAKPKGERGGDTSRSSVVRHIPAQPAPRLLDCPLIGSPFAADPNTIALPDSLPNRLGSGTPEAWPGVWGGGSALPPIPEPDAWVMLVSGFALVGMSLRRKASA